MGKLLGAITGSGSIKKANKKARAAAEFTPFNVSGPFGSGTISKEGITSSGGPGAEQVGGFQNLAQLFQGIASGAPTGQFDALDPNSAFAQAQAAGGGGAAFSQAGEGFLQSLQGFDADAFTNQQLERLRGLARPGEERAVNSMANRLFSSGRLGGDDTKSGQVFGDLAQAQEMSDLQRQLAAIGLSRDEMTNRAGMATQFANTGAGLDQAGIQNFLAQLSAGTSVGGAQQQFQTGSLQNALGATAGISTALQPSQQQIQNLLAGGGLISGANQNLAQLIQSGGIAKGNATGNFTGGLMTGAASIWG